MTSSEFKASNKVPYMIRPFDLAYKSRVYELVSNSEQEPQCFACVRVHVTIHSGHTLYHFLPGQQKEGESWDELMDPPVSSRVNNECTRMIEHFTFLTSNGLLQLAPTISNS